jgi:SAM-dependent methyltransferase
MRSHARIETIGCIDHTAIEDGVLILGGWAFSTGRPVDSFRVSSGGQAFDHVDVAMNLPSPGLAEWFQAKGKSLPQAAMAQVGNCRFGIRVRLDKAEQERTRTSIIGLVPLVGRREGNLLLNLAESYLPTPPEKYIDIIGGGYHAVSVNILGRLIQWAGLRPDMDILDAGCGVGRVAHSLVHYLAPTARYEGFDIAAPLIQWAQQNITARFPRFNFRNVDIYNKFYNPGGSIQGADFRFPYEDGSFDLVFSTSLFTHLLAADVRHYLDESYRVLRPGGRCFHTLFLLNQESESLIRAGKSLFNLVHPVGECLTHSLEAPEGAVGFPEPLMLEWIAERGFALRGKYLGDWCGRSAHQFGQDVLILEKRPRRRFWPLQWRQAG